MPELVATAGPPADQLHPPRSHTGDGGAPSKDHAHFELLFRTHRPRLVSFARRYVDCPDLAEEVVAEVFLRVWTQGTCRTGCELPVRYLFVAVRNQAFKARRHQRVAERWRTAATAQPQAPAMGQPPGAPDRDLEAAELARAVDEAVARLPERCRRAYLLHRQEGLSQAAVAEIMGISVRTVETQLGKATKALRQSLAPWLP
jgi:RNA polymerase sigma-70 factor (ECF subfamily)